MKTETEAKGQINEVMNELRYGFTDYDEAADRLFKLTTEYASQFKAASQATVEKHPHDINVMSIPESSEVFTKPSPCRPDCIDHIHRCFCNQVASYRNEKGIEPVIGERSAEECCGRCDGVNDICIGDKEAKEERLPEATNWKSALITKLSKEADSYQDEDGGTFAGGLRFAAHLVRVHGTLDDRSPVESKEDNKASGEPLRSRISDLEDELQFQSVHAQDEISTLQARIAELEKENAELDAAETEWFKSCVEYQKENDALIVENCDLESRLRSANEKIKRYEDYCLRNGLQGL